MSAEPILCRIEDGVAVVTLNNPPLNVVTLELTRRLEATLDRLADDPAARVLVLTGARERAFSSTTSRSQHTASSSPPPKASPATAAMVGFGKSSTLE